MSSVDQMQPADNAIYPTLFMEYVSSVAGWDTEEFGGWARFGSVAAISICLAMLNWRGLEIVGNASLVVSIIAMSPFLILIIVGAPKVVPSRWFQMPKEPEDGTELFDDDFQTGPGPLPLLSLGGIIWRPYLNNLFWNLNSFDNAASFAGETTSPSTTFPRGVFIGLILCVLSYILPLLVAVGATDYNQADWVDGHLGAVAVDIGGKWLGAWTIFAAGISNLALFEAEMSSDAFQLMGMGEFDHNRLCFSVCESVMLHVHHQLINHDNSKKLNVDISQKCSEQDQNMVHLQLASSLIPWWLLRLVAQILASCWSY